MTCGCNCCPGCQGGNPHTLAELAKRLIGLPIETLQLIDQLTQKATKLTQDQQSIEALDAWARDCGVRGSARSWRMKYDPWCDRWEVVLQSEELRVVRGGTKEDARAQAATAIARVKRLDSGPVEAHKVDT